MKSMRWLMASLLLPLGGCYSYAPLGRESLQPNTEVRAYLTRAGATAVPAAATDGDLVVDGEVVRWDGEDLSMDVWRADLRTGAQFRPQRQTVSIPWSAIDGLEHRQLSYWKTGALLGGVTFAAALIARGLFHGGGGGELPDGGGPRN